MNFHRAVGLGVLFNRLKTPELREAYHAHLVAGMQTYQQLQRKYKIYSHRVPQGGIYALSASLEDRWALHFKPQTWRPAPLDPTKDLAPLPKKGLRKKGMFSEIAVRERDGKRSMYFVRPNGDQVLESEIDFNRPDLLQVAYTQEMFAVYPLLTQVNRALIIGLGGGGGWYMHSTHMTRVYLLML